MSPRRRRFLIGMAIVACLSIPCLACVAVLMLALPGLVSRRLDDPLPIRPLPMRLAMETIEGVPVVRAAVGERDTRLVLDTGCSSSVTSVGGTSVRGLVIPASDVTLPSGASARLLWTRPTRIGAAIIPAHLGVVVRMDRLDEQQISGIIGMNVLGQQSILFDLPGEEIVLGEPIPAGMMDVRTVRRDTQLGCVARIAGRRRNLLLDSGCSLGVVLTAGGECRCSGRQQFMMATGMVEFDVGVVDIEIGTWRHRLACGVPRDHVIRDLDGWDGALGMDVLRLSRVWIDPKAMRIALDAPETSQPAAAKAP